MALRSGLFDSTEIVETADGYPRGDKAESADFFARYFSRFIGSGVYALPSTGFAVTVSAGLTLSVAAGDAFINGYYVFSDEAQTITLTSGSADKTCRVVLRLDTAAGAITLALLDTDVALTRTGSVYELGLADIAVPAGAVAVTQSGITDLRLNSALCGIVTGVVDQLDTSSYAAQLDSIVGDASDAYDGMTEFIGGAESEFDVWFNSMKDQLSTDAAGNLELNKAEKDLSNVETGSVTASLIANGSVGTAKIADSAIINAKLADSAVATAKIADSAVTSDKLNDGSVVESKLGANLSAAFRSIEREMYSIVLL